MENMKFAEELVREFLVFRGFTNTLQVYEKELGTDVAKGFQVDKIFDLIFSVYIPKFETEKLMELLRFFKQCFSSYETVLISQLSKLDVYILRYYVVHAIKSGRKDKVMEFFDVFGNDLLQKDQDWASWCAITYLKNPHLDPKFRLYFSKDWVNSLQLFVRNFLSEIFNALLKISSEKESVNRVKLDISQLNVKLAELQGLLEMKEAELQRFRSEASLLVQDDLPVRSISFPSTASNVERVSDDTHVPSTSVLGQKEPYLDAGATEVSESSQSSLKSEDSIKSSVMYQNGSNEMQREEAFPEVKVHFQETFLGHTSPISRCRFSVSGDNIASASVDGTVRIWTYDSSASTSRNATIYCGAEIMSLEWDCKSDRLLLIGTAIGGIKAWNADSKRVVCDLYSNKAFPSILDIKCSPVEPIFVSAAASTGSGRSAIDRLGFASLTVWNMRTWKAMTVLPLGEDPPAITSICFNHNGKLLAAGATDGMIHMFDMSSGHQITGWPAHDSAICSINEWSLQTQGKVLWSTNCGRFINSQNLSTLRHEMALDAKGRRLLVTSSSVRAPIYQVQNNMGGMRTLPHSAHITTVDWHPMLPIYLTGSADHSVRVTSIS
ncbi:hypothetical protein Leryth_016854 [Lithospermum erythrorhizon]|nr:hypothetical protein Leryth_016854 [Lithospermum erythrorhizon]